MNPGHQIDAILSADEDPVEVALRNASFDEEPETDLERESVAAQNEFLRNGGRAIPHEEAMRQLGLLDSTNE